MSYPDPTHDPQWHRAIDLCRRVAGLWLGLVAVAASGVVVALGLGAVVAHAYVGVKAIQYGLATGSALAVGAGVLPIVGPVVLSLVVVAHSDDREVDDG